MEERKYFWFLRVADAFDVNQLVSLKFSKINEFTIKLVCALNLKNSKQ